METRIRKPFQGIWNILRFNWHFYALAVLSIAIILLVGYYFSDLRIAAYVLLFFTGWTVFISLVVSFYVYDLSHLYTFSWLDHLTQSDPESIINIHAGFDETSHLLKNKFATAELQVADFYNPEKHTEISIKRARRAYPPFPNTQKVATGHLPMKNDSADKIFAILSAHEIRDEKERIAFFHELRRVVKSGGQVIVTEHLRDTANFLAYSLGFFHFHSRATWLNTFRAANLQVIQQIKVTPFITTFILEKNGASS